MCGSIMFCWAACIFIFWILFHLLSLYPQIEWLRIISSFAMALSVTLAHSLMLDQSIFFRSNLHADNDDGRGQINHVNQFKVYEYLTSSAMIFCFVLVMISMSDLRSWLYQLSAQVRNYDHLLEKLRKENPQNAEMITAFARKHQLSNSYHSHSMSRHSENHSQQVSASGVSKRTVSESIASMAATAVTLVTCGCLFNRITPDNESTADEESGKDAPGSPGGPGRDREAFSARKAESLRKANTPRTAATAAAPTVNTSTNQEAKTSLTTDDMDAMLKV